MKWYEMVSVGLGSDQRFCPEHRPVASQGGVCISGIGRRRMMLGTHSVRPGPGMDGRLVRSPPMPSQMGGSPLCPILITQSVRQRLREQICGMRAPERDQGSTWRDRGADQSVALRESLETEASEKAFEYVKARLEDVLPEDQMTARTVGMLWPLVAMESGRASDRAFPSASPARILARQSVRGFAWACLGIPT